jgi:hypothetical protein
MKNIIQFIFLLMLLACRQQNQTNNETAVSNMQISEDKTVDFEFTEETHNFGNLAAGQIVAYTFEFENTGTENIYIHSAETDCSCIKALYSEKPVVPGSSGFVEVELNTAGLNGRQLKIIEIHANTKKLKQLVIFADVKNELFII